MFKIKNGDMFLIYLTFIVFRGLRFFQKKKSFFPKYSVCFMFSVKSCVKGEKIFSLYFFSPNKTVRVG